MKIFSNSDSVVEDISLSVYKYLSENGLAIAHSLSRLNRN